MTAPATLLDGVKHADALALQGDVAGAEHAYLAILNDAVVQGDDATRGKEAALLQLAALYKKHAKAQPLADLAKAARQFLGALPKAKTAKLTRTLIDHLAEIPGSLDVQVLATKDAIAWAEAEKRVFLRQALETRLAGMYLDNKMFTEALALIATLLRELKRLDDKQVLVDVHLLESRVFLALRNLAKSRAALTSARTAANAIYCPPLMQAALDMQSGILHAEEKDFKTAFSYFYETLEGYAGQEDPRAVIALKYMMLCKVMLNLTDDINALLHHKVATRFSGSADVAAMRAVTDALVARSLLDFEKALATFRAQLHDDPVVHAHLRALYDKLLEQNLVRVIEPYARVEISHVANLVKLPLPQVEQKLSQLILDGKIHGVLDQGAGILEIYDATEADATYTDALEAIKKMGSVVDSLYGKAAQLT